MKRNWIEIAVVVLVLLLLMSIFVDLVGQPLVVVFTLITGWYGYLKRVLPQVSVNWAGLALAGVYVVMIVVIGHWLCGWLWRQTGHAPRWRARWTAAGVAVIVLMFAAGTAAVGIAHQTAWLARSPERMFAGRSSGRVRCMSNMRQIYLAIAAYAQDHGGRYPDRLEELVETGLIEYPHVFICPGSPHDDRAPGATTKEWLPHLSKKGHLSYTYLGKGMTMPAKSGERAVVLYESLENHEGKGISVLFDDGAVEFVAADKAKELIERATSTRPVE